MKIVDLVGSASGHHKTPPLISHNIDMLIKLYEGIPYIHLTEKNPLPLHVCWRIFFAIFYSDTASACLPPSDGPSNSPYITFILLKLRSSRSLSPVSSSIPSFSHLQRAVSILFFNPTSVALRFSSVTLSHVLTPSMIIYRRIAWPVYFFLEQM